MPAASSRPWPARLCGSSGERKPRSSAVGATRTLWFSAPLAAAASIAILSVSASVWLAIENARLRRAPVPAPAPVSERPVSTPSADPPQIADVRLSPVVLRSEQSPPVVSLPTQARLARLLLPTGETGPSFVVGIERAGVGRVSTQAGLAISRIGNGGGLGPCRTADPGDYEILLWQSREAPASLVGTYLVRIRPQG